LLGDAAHAMGFFPWCGEASSGRSKASGSSRVALEHVHGSLDDLKGDNISVAATMPGAFSPGGLCDEHLQGVSVCSQLLVTATMPGGGAPGGLCDNYSQEFAACSQLSAVGTMPGCVAPGGLVDVHNLARVFMFVMFVLWLLEFFWNAWRVFVQFTTSEDRASNHNPKVQTCGAAAAAPASVCECCRRELPVCLHHTAAAIMPGGGAPGGVGGEHLRESPACLQLPVAAASLGGEASGGLGGEYVQLAGAATLPGGGAPGGLRGAHDHGVEQSGDGCGSRLGPAKPSGIDGSSTWPVVPQVTAPPRGSMTQLLLWIDRAEVAGAAARSHGLLACGSQVLELDALVCSRSAWQVGLAEFAATASVAGSGLALPQCVSGDAAVEAVTSVGSEGSCSSRNSSGSSSRRRNHSADLRFEHPLGGPPPRGQCRLDPLAGWLKAGDEPGFIAHARLALPSDWLLRTFRQQKRSIGKLRRSHFSGNAAVAGGLLLRAGRAFG
jgi:hypothetical protein